MDDSVSVGEAKVAEMQHVTRKLPCQSRAGNYCAIGRGVLALDLLSTSKSSAKNPFNQKTGKNML